MTMASFNPPSFSLFLSRISGMKARARACVRESHKDADDRATQQRGICGNEAEDK